MTAAGEISWVLVTNDDGCDSPALVPLMRELLARAEVSALVPEREYSWSSKTMSRFGVLELSGCERDGITFFAANGSPADCANLGIHKLKPSKPELLVSGINIGANAGLGYLLSSGTIGAAIEGMLSGIPAVALSLQLHSDDYRDWRTNRNPDRLVGSFSRAAAVAADIVGEVLAGGLPSEASILSVNMPPDVTRDSPRRFSGVTDSRYGSFFSETEEGRYVYGFDKLDFFANPTVPSGRPGDLETLAGGAVAMTPLRFDLNVEASAQDRCRFERSHTELKSTKKE
jgi:5'-nucleotidase